MLPIPSNRGLWPVAIAVTCAALIASAPSGAQERALEAPATPEPPKEVTSADFAIQANAVEGRLDQIQSDVSAIDVTDSVAKALDEIEAQGTELQGQFDALETRRMMISELNALNVQLDLLNARTNNQIAKLSAYASELEQLATQNEQDIEVWAKALRMIRKSSVPKVARDRTVSILHGLRQGREVLDKKLNDVLSLQSRALDVRDSVNVAERAVTLAQDEQADAVFQRQAPPFWSSEVDSEDGAAPEGYDIHFSWPAVSDYLKAESGGLVFQLLLSLLLGWLLVRARAFVSARIAKRQQEGGPAWEDQAMGALRHPWAASLLVVISCYRFFYPDRVADMILLTWVIALPLWFVVFRAIVPAAFRKPLIGLALLGTAHIVVTMVSGHPRMERLLLIFELVLAGAGAGWMIRFLRDVEVPKRLRQGLWFSLVNVGMRLMVLTALVGVVATALGYTYLGAETATAVIIGTIAATVCIALARIFEALVSYAIFAGKLDGFRMIRANRDVTAKGLSRLVRLLAAGLFVWSLADMTSAWRPTGRMLGRPLTSDLGMGFVETGVKVGDLFAFFIILWLSWLLARFVAFVLREEILPRLHMQTGVPYALTTFTRYAIIAIGFIAAMSVLGISIDRLTIVLSALGVGIGFGLQGLVNNFVSGFILLTERPVRLRDKVEIEGVLGHVSSIGIRASTIRTFDGAEVIVPNGDLISRQVVNWTLSARQQRVTIPIGVAYGTDPNQVLNILTKIAADNEKVFKDPAPLALFRGFGDSSLDFELRIFMDPSDVLDVPSAVTVAINDSLNEAGIEIPFPKRDLYLRGVPEGFAGTGTGTGTGTDAGTDTDAGTGTGTDTDTDTGTR